MDGTGMYLFFFLIYNIIIIYNRMRRMKRAQTDHCAVQRRARPHGASIYMVYMVSDNTLMLLAHTQTWP